MSDPIDSLRFVHAAIIKESEDLEQIVTSAVSPEEAGAHADRIEFFARLVDGHTSGEEFGLFPPLAQRHETIAETYLFDHEEERQLFDELAALAGRCVSGDHEALPRLRRQMVVLSAHTHSHVAKENDLILPRVASLFTPAEQGEIVSDILSTFTPEDTARAVPWIVDRLDPDRAASYVEVLSTAMPPPVFQAAKGWIRDGIGPEHWDAVVELAPVLESD